MIDLQDQTAPITGRNGPSRVELVLAESIGKLSKVHTDAELEAALKQLATGLATLDSIQRPLARNAAMAHLKKIGVQSPASVVKGVWQSIVPPPNSDDITLADVEPADGPVDGVRLLDGLEEYFRKYVYLPEHGPAALAGWTVATWFVDEVYFAPLLVLLSATKRCGKTLLLDLLRSVTRRGIATSGIGITPAVLFRLNEQRHPTLLIDEAEKLDGRNADRELVALLNTGHRRGAQVHRCGERANGEIVVEHFDAFGFRALAAIGGVRDTLLDRSITLRLERKPRDADVERFSGRVVAKEGFGYAREIACWAADHASEIGQAEEHAPKPTWLGDREADNWSPIFAVAKVAGGRWPDLMFNAAKTLRLDTDDEADIRERLIHDIRNVFEEAGNPEVIKSGELVKQLNDIETAPWGDLRGGDGLSPIKLAALLKPFGIRPFKARPSGGESIRGHWLQSFESVFARYPSPASVPTVPTGTSQEKRGIPANQTVPDLEGRDSLTVPDEQKRDSSSTPETPVKMGNGTVGTVGTVRGGPQSYEEIERVAIQQEESAA